MRRIVPLVLGLALFAALLIFVLGRNGSSATSVYKVDVLFDDARGLVAGQTVKVAGAKVGKIDDVALTKGYQAKVEVSVDPRFAPFRSDAACTIRPEGLIAENFVECDPGTQSKGELAKGAGGVPTVSASRNTEPVNLTDLFNIFNTPTRDRFRVIVNELGIGVAGRGEDMNVVIRRANPSLALTRRALSIVNGQRAQLGSLIDASDQLVAKLAARTPRTQQFLDRSASVSTRLAKNRGPLAQTVKGLPALLTQTRGALHQLDAVAASGTPLVKQLGVAAPALNKVTKDLPAFAKAAPSAVSSLGGALDTATPVVKKLKPVVTTLRSYAQGSLPSAQRTGTLFANLQAKGFVENFLSLFYYGAAATSRYDATSHILPVRTSFGPCLIYATTPSDASCNANFSKAPAAAAQQAQTATKDTTPAKPAVPLPGLPGVTVPSTSTPAPAPATPTVPSVTIPPLPAVPDAGAQVVKPLLDFLLGP